MAIKKQGVKSTRKRRVKSPLVKAKDKAWAEFSRFIRLRDADDTGHCKCVTCNREYHWKKIQAGHFIPGRTNAVLFEEKGVHAQCYGCNIGKAGNTIMYWPWMEQQYGRGYVDYLRGFIGTKLTYTEDDYLAIHKRYKKLAAELEENIT